MFLFFISDTNKSIIHNNKKYVWINFLTTGGGNLKVKSKLKRFLSEEKQICF